MAKKLKHTIGTDTPIQFEFQEVAFDGTKTTRDLTGMFLYLEIERDGVDLLSLDNDGVGGFAITDAVNGLAVATIPQGFSDAGGDADFAALARVDPGGIDSRSEPIRGTICIIPAIVDVP